MNRYALPVLLALSAALPAQAQRLNTFDVAPPTKPTNAVPKSYVDSVVAAAIAQSSSSTIDLTVAGVLAKIAKTGIALDNPGGGAVQQNTTYASGGMDDGVLLSPGRNGISFCPPLSCVTSPSADHQRTSALFWSTTADDNHSEEQTVAVLTTINKGAFRLWTKSTNYTAGENLRIPATNAMYRAVTSGVSASYGAGPIGKGSSVTDGTVVWSWINDSAIASKVGQYIETQVQPGAGNAWGQAINFQLQPGSLIPQAFVLTSELDFTNNSGTDCAAGINTCVGLQIFMGGTNKSTAAIAIAPNGIVPTSSGAALFGVFTNGNIASYSDLEISSTGSEYGISFNSFVGGGHTTATIIDASTGPQGILFTGTKQFQDISIRTTTPAGISNTGTHSLTTFYESSSSPTVFDLTGTHSGAVFSDRSISPAALNLSGNYSLAAVRTTDSPAAVALAMKATQKVCFDDLDACLVLGTGSLRYVKGGVVMFGVDSNGNATFKGTVTQSGNP